MKPLTAATYTAIGFVQALTGKLEEAVEALHRSLALKRDDIVTSALLKYCLEDLMEEDTLPENIGNAEGIEMQEEMSDEKSDIMTDCSLTAFSKTAEQRPVRKLKLKYDDSPCSGTVVDSSYDMSMEI